MKKKSPDFGIFFVVILVLAMVSASGYIGNIYQLTKIGFDMITPTLVLKCVGVVVPPVGVIMGWIGMS